jgi:hypothetical protein
MVLAVVVIRMALFQVEGLHHPDLVVVALGVVAVDQVDHKDIPVVLVFQQIQEITVQVEVVVQEVLEPQVMLLLVDMVVLVFNFPQHSEIPYQE